MLSDPADWQALQEWLERLVSAVEASRRWTVGDWLSLVVAFGALVAAGAAILSTIESRRQFRRASQLEALRRLADLIPLLYEYPRRPGARSRLETMRGLVRAFEKSRVPNLWRWLEGEPLLDEQGAPIDTEDWRSREAAMAGDVAREIARLTR